MFCSLSDNIQETFGLTPIEAMAAGLPVVVTDWDGYRDTVRDGIDGFAVPTTAAPPGTGQGLAARHALEVDNYDAYIGKTSTAVVVDIDATTAAFERLASNPDLRRRMGTNGAVRARDVFDWKVIIKAYEDLWRELAILRDREAPPPSPGMTRGFWPARPDPFELFASFPTAVFSRQHVFTQAPGLTEAEVLERLNLRIALVSASPEISSTLLLTVWKQVGSQGATAKDILGLHPGTAPALTVRGLLWLAKLGFISISA